MTVFNIAILVITVINLLFLIALTIGLTMVHQDLERKIQISKSKDN